MTIWNIQLQGAPRDMGRQHGRQVQGVRPLLAQVVAARLTELREMGADRAAVLDPLREALQELDRPLLEFLNGLAEALALDEEDLLRYTYSSYLKDLEKGRQDTSAGSLADGCTTWAASAPVTRDGLILVAKNRDYHRDHIPLQLMARVAPEDGYRYVTLGSAGSPHVFSSGINERGLAVADTHVLSRDLGPGMARFSLMRELLERQATVEASLDYLRSVPQMGGGTVILADTTGRLAVWESGHRQSGHHSRREGYLASTNHFVSPELAGQWIENEAPAWRGNSPARYQRVLNALAGRTGEVDVSWAQGLAAAHGTMLDSICRHAPDQAEGTGDTIPPNSTISAVILLPRGWEGNARRQRALLVAAGQPCQATWEAWQV